MNQAELPITGRDRSRGERGVGIIEFALILPLLLILTLGVIDVSRGFWVKNVAYQAAREGARHLVVRSVSDSASVRGRVQEVVESAGISLKTLNITDAGTGGLMEVRVGVEFNWLYPGLFAWIGADYTNPVILVGTTKMRKEG